LIYFSFALLALLSFGIIVWKILRWALFQKIMKI
jgi:hypothetical protein